MVSAHPRETQMDLTLTRTNFIEEGIFGRLTGDFGKLIVFTLEHAYQNGQEFEPKIPVGTYVCVRGEHRLVSMPSDFTTFEITGVPNHDKILFHVGNYNKDSSGCVLLGEAISGTSIVYSRSAFNEFMLLQSGIDSFILKVQNLALT